ncbi:LolA family protein [Garciella nitratireducens]|uniref:Outer membrane lipoprotein-sorting protein n=1 Tax=Garciella nitratireducens DSM 15102 TaxID=1121911 RepID=A0A1T4NQ68_9FIRM|nr:outer membrane lipoprotein carrier protein LolA [Garciella nitratireducens]SJZ81207.1 Outer membrane lipoprotein-sorting protein [Garciella nitratireducens DSM 15102]
MKVKLLLFFVGIFLLLSGCSSSDLTKEEVIERVQKKFGEVKTYQCIVEAEVIGNKGSQVYKIKEFYKNGCYRLETLSPKNLEGKTVVVKQNKAKIYHPSIHQSIIIDDFTTNHTEGLFLGDFLSWNFQESVEIEESNMNNQEYVIVKKVIDEQDYYHYQKSLWINKKNMLPKYIKVYDKEENIRLHLNLQNLMINEEIDDKLFQLE